MAFLVAAKLAEAFLRLEDVERSPALGLPHSRPMPSIGARCDELRIVDETCTWRIVYRIDRAAILVVEVFAKKTQATPAHVIDVCKKRLREWDKE